jgi:MFS transporter, putative metabolite:H+ symporter
MKESGDGIVGGSPISALSIAARLERLPVSAWHVKMRVILGSATFFDAFDALAIAYALPVLIPAFKIAPSAIGPLISIGYAGQALGALFFGWLAERIGRVRTAQITIAIFGLMSLVCATAQDYDQLFWYRFLQGLGLGGEVPIAAAYISEIARADRRGPFFLFYEFIFPVGLVAVALAGAYLVPRYGWQWLFLIGGLPALVTVAMQFYCPESPRWLAAKGRLAEADAVLARIEREISRGGTRPLPPPPARAAAAPAAGATRWVELFEGRYRARTLVAWVLWFCGYLMNYGLTTWLPTFYRAEFKLSLQQSLNFSLATAVTGLFGSLMCALLIDRLGRRVWFVGAFMFSGALLMLLGAIGTGDVARVVALTSLSFIGIASINLGLYLYTPEIYPTRIRALGSSWATFWLRAAGVVGPVMVGWLLRFGVDTVFLVFGLFGAVGAVTAWLGVTESRLKMLEDISP